MSDELQSYLKLALLRLEKASAEIEKTQGINQDTETLRLLTELVKEQVPHEDHRHTTRQTR